MRRIQSYLAGLLILSVSLLALPGAFLHDCGHIEQHAHAHHNDHDHVAPAPTPAPADGQATIDHGYCVVCDLSAPAVPSSLVSFDFSRADFPFLRPQKAQQEYAAKWMADAPSRAPPMA
jgi:hypothetical protein